MLVVVVVALVLAALAPSSVVCVLHIESVCLYYILLHLTYYICKLILNVNQYYLL